MTCRVIKDEQPQDCERAQEELEKGSLEPPLLTNLALAVADIDPVHGRKYFPINQAIGLAIEKVGYQVEKLIQ